MLLLSVVTVALFAAGESNAALITAHTFKCVDVEGSRIANFTPIQLYDCHGEFNQQFDFRENGLIVGIGTQPFNGVFKCLDVLGGRTANGTPVILFDCHGGLNQQWYYFNGQIISRQSGKCLDIPNNNLTNGNNLQIFSCNQTTAQKWRIH